jgi:predicted protein tyrosine phosphatase
MIEIYPNLFIGNEQDYESRVRHEPGWCTVHACKEPYHRQALGYHTKAAPKNHPEYLIARRGNRLILNLVDAPDPAYIPKEIIDAALEFIEINLKGGNHVLVHCNEGCSRSAGIGLLYLAKHTDRLPKRNFIEAEAAFRALYPPYNPKSGIRGFMMANWTDYTQNNPAREST